MAHSLHVSVLAAITLGLAPAGPAAAQEWPTKPIRIVVPYTTGGSTDIVARIVSPHLGDVLGKAVFIENKPGAGSSIGVDAVAKSPPDGTTFGIVNIAFVANPSLIKKLPYDTEKDLTAVTLISTSTLVAVVPPSVPAKTLKEFVAYAKSKPGEVFYASAGQGTGNHLLTERFNNLAGIKMTHVPYKGGGPSVQSVVAGETSLLLASIPSVVQYFPNGRLVPLAVGSLKRNPALPDVPTISEALLPGFEAMEWIGLVAPAGTPPAIVDRMQQAMAKVLAMPEVKSRLVGMAADPVGSTPQEFSAFITREIAAWNKVIKDVGITVE